MIYVSVLEVIPKFSAGDAAGRTRWKLAESNVFANVRGVKSYFNTFKCLVMALVKPIHHVNTICL